MQQRLRHAYAYQFGGDAMPTYTRTVNSSDSEHHQPNMCDLRNVAKYMYIHLFSLHQYVDIDTEFDENGENNTHQ